MLALGITFLCCVGIFVFSFNTKYDLSSCHGLVFCLLWGLLLTFLLMPIPYGSTSNKVFAGIGAIIFMFVLVYDIHRVMGRSTENALSPEEYIVGALEIYSDIINIFIRILQIAVQR
ncbi:protein lifeguard 2 [Galendromus occidentalis]|uniref:Protein lifeguard 2 n=1 Tax=Galendromus occidentalis TaxID=34638 RepID=A0AAJ6QQ04_9ACAR|nr:protein lifeguard 2 [Galendromus occidentalis]XP_003740097.1 protein lifeguard 2 [Galendromus occidentalis]